MAFKRSAVRSRLSPPSVRQVFIFLPFYITIKIQSPVRVRFGALNGAILFLNNYYLQFAEKEYVVLLLNSSPAFKIQVGHSG